MTTMHVNPWSVLGHLMQEIDRGNAVSGDDALVTADYRPAVDIRELADAYVLYADLPGVAAADIDIQMEDGVLTIRGERRVRQTDGEGEVKRSERAQGVFYRRFALPESVDADGIRAHAEQGVLELRIPKQARVMPRRITVSAGSASPQATGGAANNAAVRQSESA